MPGYRTYGDAMASLEYVPDDVVTMATRLRWPKPILLTTSVRNGLVDTLPSTTMSNFLSDFGLNGFGNISAVVSSRSFCGSAANAGGKNAGAAIAPATSPARAPLRKTVRIGKAMTASAMRGCN